MPRRTLSLTAELIAAVERIEPDAGLEDGLTPLTAEDYDRLANDVLDHARGGPVHIFAYGSLIWKPEFEPVRQVRGRAYGWRRSFCLPIMNWRGTPQQPGLMMALDHGGSCDGLLLQFPQAPVADQLRKLLRREMTYVEDVQSFRRLRVDVEGTPVDGYTFYAAPRSKGYYMKLPLDQQAYRIARAAGHWGTNAAYLHNTILKLAEHGIHDSYLWQLQHHVADEIRRLHPGLPA